MNLNQKKVVRKCVQELLKTMYAHRHDQLTERTEVITWITVLSWTQEFVQKNLQPASCQDSQPWGNANSIRHGIFSDTFQRLSPYPPVFYSRATTFLPQNRCIWQGLLLFIQGRSSYLHSQFFSMRKWDYFFFSNIQWCVNLAADHLCNCRGG